MSAQRNGLIRQCWSAMVCAVLLPAGLLAAEPAKPDANAGNRTKAASGQLGMSVTGTQEAPQVMYVVPWKTLDAVPAEPFVSGLLDEVFSPVDPVVFERSVQQHEQVRAAAPAAVVEQ